jgi:hypothetical protein
MFQLFRFKLDELYFEVMFLNVWVVNKNMKLQRRGF